MPSKDWKCEKQHHFLEDTVSAVLHRIMLIAVIWQERSQSDLWKTKCIDLTHMLCGYAGEKLPDCFESIDSNAKQNIDFISFFLIKWKSKRSSSSQKATAQFAG